MNDRTALQWLENARHFACALHAITLGLDPDAFEADIRTQYTVRYYPVVIGEVLNQVPKDVQASPPEIPWQAIYDLRNRFVHRYFLIDARHILRIAQDDTVTLDAALDQLIGILPR